MVVFIRRIPNGTDIIESASLAVDSTCRAKEKTLCPLMGAREGGRCY